MIKNEIVKFSIYTFFLLLIGTVIKRSIFACHCLAMYVVPALWSNENSNEIK